jgi:hypothetical protein
MYKESYNFHLGELIDYYRDIWNGEEKMDEDFINEFQLSLLKLDTMITRMKYLQDMPELDTSLLNTDMLSDSFMNAKSNEYFRPEDYERHFLVYSLLKHDDISNQYLHQILDGFFKYRKVRRNLKFRDIERTSTGSVRCKTNLRFAIFYLREYGLINYHESGRRAWSLTLPGFLIAAYMCLDKSGLRAYSFDMKRIYHPYNNTYVHFDVKITNIIAELCENENLDKVFNFVDVLSDDKQLKKISGDIFIAYRDFLKKAKQEKESGVSTRRRFVMSMGEFMQVHNTKSRVDFFKSRFSDLINADKFFNELIGSVNGEENES